MADQPAGGDPGGAGAVRADDAFDVAAVDAWLRAELGDDAPAGAPEVRQFAGGASNLTYLLRYPDRELVLRRPPPGTKAGSAHDMAREFRIQQQLRPEFDRVPRVVALCRDAGVLGADFYVMERIAGTILRGDLPAGVELTPERAGDLCRTAVDTLVELHAVDPAAAGLADLDRGPGYVERQVRGWTDRYARARTDNVPDFAQVTAWLADHMPADGPHCVIHGDFRLDNLVLEGVGGPGTPRVAGVLDWELATVGDPLMDLGSALAYWVQADDDPFYAMTRRQPSHLPGMLTRAGIVAHYAERTGRAVPRWEFYEVFGLFRLAVIAQQIYYRYHHGQTTNPAFKDFWTLVAYLDQRCRRLLGLGAG